MKIKSLLILALFGLTLNAQAQSYNFSLSTGSYSDLIGSTSLNNGMTWDDPQFTIPIGFNFQYFDLTINQLFFDEIGLGGFLTTAETSETSIASLLIPYGADIIDRGYDFNKDISTSGSLSNISYLLEGTVGSQILKIEWQNVGFYSELEEDNISSDFTNFQLWLYEGTNDIEIHFGSNLINQPNLSFDGETGSFVALLNDYNFENDTLIGGIVLEGNPASPTQKQISFLDSMPLLNGIIPNGTIYKFSKFVTGISENKNSFINVLFYPNPTNDYFNISVNDLDTKINTVSILNINGQSVKEVNYNNDAIDISDLNFGVYIIKINTTAGMLTKRLVKK